MTRLLIDASVWLAAFDSDDSQHVAANRLLDDVAEGSAEALALDLTLYEVANAAVMMTRDFSLASQLVTAVDRIVAEPPIPVDTAMLGAATEMAVEHSITVYDAAYVAVARSNALDLVSCDVKDLVSNGLARLP